jgi:hypothetical protein
MVGGVRSEEFELIAQASQALEYGLHDAARKILAIIESEVWRSFETPNGRQVTHERFEDFVCAKGLDGLNSDVRTVENVCRDNRRARDALDRALQRTHGGYRSKRDNVNHAPVGDTPTGNAVAQALRRLRKDRPDLHARVLADELSPHAAMIEAGFRHRSATVPLHDMCALAAALRRRLSDDQLAELTAKLS